MLHLFLIIQLHLSLLSHEYKAGEASQALYIKHKNADPYTESEHVAQPIILAVSIRWKWKHYEEVFRGLSTASLNSPSEESLICLLKFPSHQTPQALNQPL